MPEPLGDDETGVPAQLVHEFLVSICTVPNAGICQRDNGWYTAKANDEGDEQKQPNATLSKFIYTLHRTTDLRQQELVLKALHACPAMVHRYNKRGKTRRLSKTPSTHSGTLDIGSTTT